MENLIRMELTLEQALQKGIEAHKAGNAQEADKYYTAILKAQPKHSHANHNMGVLAVSVGKTEDSLPYFKTALQADPSVAQFWLSYMDALIKLKRMDEAKAIFEQAKSKGAKGDGFDKIEIKLKPLQHISGAQYQSYNHIVQEAKELHENGKYKDAIIILEKVIKDFPKNEDMPAILARCYLLLDDLTQAQFYLDELKKLSPTSALAGWAEARILLKQSKIDEALIVAKKNNKIFPNDVEGMNVLGSCLRANGEINESLKLLNKAIEINSNYAEALINRGLIFFGKGNKSNALEDLQKAHQLKPHIVKIWHLVLGLKIELHEFEETINLAKTMLEIEPGDPKLFAAIALCHVNLKNYSQAELFYRKVLEIEPDYAEAWLNLGSALRAKGEFDAALDAYHQAVSLNPTYSAYSNLGVAIFERGNSTRAIEACTKALSLKPDFYAAWSNLYYPLQTVKNKVNLDTKLDQILSKVEMSNDAKSALNILQFRLHRGAPNEDMFLNNALESLSSVENQKIQNSTFDKNSNISPPQIPDKTVALVHFGRSGTGLLHSLIDGHPEISTLPSIYFSEYFDPSNWAEISSGGRKEIVARFMSTYDVLFDASSPVPIESKDKNFIYNIGQKEGMMNVGDDRDEILRVDRTAFSSELNRLLDFYENIDATIFFNLVHQAFDKAINDQCTKKLMFYHIHNPSPISKLNFIRTNPKAHWLIMVREPIQSCESWIKKKFSENSYSDVAGRVLTMLFSLDDLIHQRQNHIGVRLEDLKEHPKQTITALCDWMDVKEVDSLYEMTAQGKKWWGDPGSPDYTKDGMDPFGKTSINRKLGSVFSENDQFILKTLFYPFSARFGYVKENQKQFLGDLQRIQPMLDDMFDFEKKLAEQSGLSTSEFQSRGSYSYFRSGLFERYNTLKEHGTYPNMIKALQLDA